MVFKRVLRGSQLQSDCKSIAFDEVVDPGNSSGGKETPRKEDNLDLCILDNYSCHLQKSTLKALDERGYFVIIEGGGITGDWSPPDTRWHCDLRREYRALEDKWYLEQMQGLDPNMSCPSPTRTLQMTWYLQAVQRLFKKGQQQALDREYRRLAFSNALDGSEDGEMSEKIKEIWQEQNIGEFRRALMTCPKEDIPETMYDLRHTLEKPEGCLAGIGIRGFHPPKDRESEGFSDFTWHFRAPDGAARVSDDVECVNGHDDPEDQDSVIGEDFDAAVDEDDEGDVDDANNAEVQDAAGDAAAPVQDLAEDAAPAAEAVEGAPEGAARVAQPAHVASARRVDEMMQEILQMPTAPTLHGVKTRAVTALQTFAKRLRDYEDPQVKEADKREAPLVALELLKGGVWVSPEAQEAKQNEKEQAEFAAAVEDERKRAKGAARTSKRRKAGDVYFEEDEDDDDDGEDDDAMEEDDQEGEKEAKYVAPVVPPTTKAHRAARQLYLDGDLPFAVCKLCSKPRGPLNRAWYEEMHYAGLAFKAKLFECSVLPGVTCETALTPEAKKLNDSLS